jgi:hypothetical protein
VLQALRHALSAMKEEHVAMGNILLQQAGTIPALAWVEHQIMYSVWQDKHIVPFTRKWIQYFAQMHVGRKYHVKVVLCDYFGEKADC